MPLASIDFISYFNNSKRNGNKKYKEHPLLPIELLNFIVTILTQISSKQLELKNKSLTTNLYNLLSLFCYSKTNQRSLRIHKYFKYFLSLQEKWLKENEWGELASLGFTIISKMTYKNQNNQKYYFQKNGHKYLKLLLNKDSDIYTENENEALNILINCCDIEDLKLLLWSYGWIDILIVKLNYLLNSSGI